MHPNFPELMSLFRALAQKPYSFSRRFGFCRRTLITLPPSQIESDQKKKPLNLVFQEAVGLCSKTETDNDANAQNNEVKNKLWELEQEIRHLKEADPEKNKTAEQKKPKSLYGLFTGREIPKNEDVKKRREAQSPMILKELSVDMKMFVNHLYNEGYFRDANFLRRGQLDFSCFNDSYGRDFIKFAAEKFGKDHQEIAKWLSGSDLKKVALFGCPSLSRKNVFSAKRLRQYFEIQENTVCSKCILKHSCKFVNQSVWKGDHKTLNLAVVMRVITLYALEAAQPEMSLPDEIKASVSRLLNEILRLTQTTL